MSVNQAQLDVLDALADGPKCTSNVTRGDVVSGVAVAALVRRELVTVKDRKDGQREVKITRTGRTVQRKRG